MAILSRDKTKLSIFMHAVTVDRNLPKWVAVRKEQQKKYQNSLKSEDDADELEDGETSMTLDGFRLRDERNFNIYLNKVMEDNLRNQNMKISQPVALRASDDANNEEQDEKPSFIRKILRRFQPSFATSGHKDEEKEEAYELDILAFFEAIKLTTAEAAQKYQDRIEPYILAIEAANSMGQQALVEKMMANLNHQRGN